MSTLILVRHGQASFFSDDYDRLSPLGEEQSRMLGRHWAKIGITPDEIHSGTLRRQVRTAEMTGEGMREAGLPWPGLQTFEGFNEYNADEILKHLLPELKERDADFGKLEDEMKAATEPRDRYRTFHRLLEAVMTVWASGEYDSDGAPSWTEFRDGVRDGLRRIMASGGGGRTVAVFTSGGPVGIGVQTALRAPDQTALDLNWRVRNAAISTFTFGGGRVSLDSFNDITHLGDPKFHTYR